MRHVADRHPALHRELLDGLAAVFDDVALPATGAGVGDQGEDHVLGGDAGGQRAVDGDGHRLRLGLGQGLGGEHVLDLGGADAEGDRAERAVGGRCASRRTRSSCRAGSGRAAGRRRGRCPARRRRAGGVARRSRRRSCAGCRPASWRPGSAIGLSQSSVGTLWSSVASVRSGRRTCAVRQAQAVEGLRRGHLVEEVEIDVEKVGLSRSATDDVLVPHLLGQGLAHDCSFSRRAGRTVSSRSIDWSSSFVGRTCGGSDTTACIPLL